MRLIAGRYAEIANTRRVGGQAEVFEAADLHQGGRNVAVKLVPATSDEIYRIYFERETAAHHKLDHPNIVSLLDSGTDHGVGVYYVVLSWVPVSLQDWLVATAPETPGWDDVAEVIALPLASALAHAHSMAVLHRDIKPSNVLWDGEKPLIADFALSKIKDQLAGATDATVAGMTSAPWAPPDLASRGSTRFDVYSLAATLLQCVTGWELRDLPDIARALDEADLPPAVLALLRRCLSVDAAKRPADGQQFYLELQAIQAARSENWHDQKVLSFELSGTARRSLEEAGDGRSADNVIAGLLGAATYVLPRLKNIAGRMVLTADEFRLVGDQVELVLVFKNRHQLLCTRAEVKDFDELERWRHKDEAVVLDSRDLTWTTLRSTNPQRAAAAADELRLLLEKAVQDAGDRHSDTFKQARLTNWSQLIEAKEALEKRLEEPITYTRVSRDGVLFDVQTTTPLTGAFLDQERMARPVDEPAMRGVAVTIAEVDGTDITVRATRPGVDLPFHGVLVRDRTPSQAAIRRQKTALAALRDGSSARPHLRELVLDPSVASAPEPVAFEPLRPDFDDDKKVAVAHALGSPDLFLVQGPPGTGKTSFIAELVHQHLAARPGDKVLLVSQMHVAIDNAVTRLYRSGVTSVVRLSSRDDNVDPDAAHLLLSNKLRAWADEIRARARAGMAALADREGLQVDHLSLALRVEEALATLRQKTEIAELLGPLDDDDRLDNEDLSEERAELLADYLRAVERADTAAAEVRTAARALEVTVPDDLGEPELEKLVAGLLDAPGAGPRLRELLRTQGDWLASLNDPQTAEPMFLPTQSVVAGTCMGFLANPHIQNMQFDLCIIDEASRATAPELLVPMTRAKRWVMVGDTKQLPPMVEEVFEHRDLVETFDLDKMFLTSSLFDILLGEAPPACTASLVTQHRMAQPIGELISQVFYSGTLVHDPVPVLAPESVNDSDRLVWFSTSRRTNRHEDAHHAGSASTSNKLEAKKVAGLVARLDTDVHAGKYARTDGGKLEVLILTGYRRQCTEIERALRRLTLRHVTVQVKTVDAVQGREADVVIFSVTRSNLSGELGFLADRYEGRVNVALSRARELLWIVGDSEFCSSKQGPLNRVLTHITTTGGRVQYL
ncbi:serine/threonine-protein kinase [Micromonospora aurantiaca (nom. illeg.)]|uniref:serine/threonine-protein kinase n=1 Tax=Micromonospora aurantiaca (nom. illeg.) TaxID=47850 RepID=UPI00082847CE|nr:serine/threonine-protein kinase [Micromonospora aurantiaca]SCL35858.1 Protein kinase domain-containing protein [Micromonospora aurantiaca]